MVIVTTEVDATMDFACACVRFVAVIPVVAALEPIGHHHSPFQWQMN